MYATDIGMTIMSYIDRKNSDLKKIAKSCDTKFKEHVDNLNAKLKNINWNEVKYKILLNCLDENGFKWKARVDGGHLYVKQTKKIVIPEYKQKSRKNNNILNKIKPMANRLLLLFVSIISFSMMILILLNNNGNQSTLISTLNDWGVLFGVLSPPKCVFSPYISLFIKILESIIFGSTFVATVLLAIIGWKFIFEFLLSDNEFDTTGVVALTCAACNTISMTVSFVNFVSEKIDNMNAVNKDEIDKEFMNIGTKIIENYNQRIKECDEKFKTVISEQNQLIKNEILKDDIFN